MPHPRLSIPSHDRQKFIMDPRVDELALHQRDWDELAGFDPLWSVLTRRDRKGGGWDLDEFLATGDRDVSRMLAAAAEHGHPRERGRALDFGCGVGRLTRALGAEFAEVVAVDISAVMIARARELCRDHANVRFAVNLAGDLSCFESASFDLVCSTLVLQHLPQPAAALRFVAEFIRLLRPGGIAVFQMPTRVPWRGRPLVRRRLYRVLRALGFEARLLMGPARTNPMRMQAVPEDVMRAWIGDRGGVVVGITSDPHTPPPIESLGYLVVPA
jgi:SAM-dependent methyltransferase